MPPEMPPQKLPPAVALKALADPKLESFDAYLRLGWQMLNLREQQAVNSWTTKLWRLNNSHRAARVTKEWFVLYKAALLHLLTQDHDA